MNSYDPTTVHKITRGQMEHIYKCLRYIDDARKALEQRNDRSSTNCASAPAAFTPSSKTWPSRSAYPIEAWRAFLKEFAIEEAVMTPP
jgi:hypothetical protein